MNILIIDNGSKHTDEFPEQLTNQGHNIKIIKYRKHTRVDLDWADLYLLSGGKKPVLFNRYFNKEIELIKSTDKPILGICLGMELIAKSYQGNLLKKRNKILGIKNITVRSEAFGFDQNTNFNVYEAHKWIVTDVKDFEVIGWSDRGLEIIKHPIRPIIGLQFHPEVNDPENDGMKLLEACFQRILQLQSN